MPGELEWKDPKIEDHNVYSNEEQINSLNLYNSSKLLHKEREQNFLYIIGPFPNASPVSPMLSAPANNSVIELWARRTGTATLQ